MIGRCFRVPAYYVLVDDVDVCLVTIRPPLVVDLPSVGSK